MLVARRVTVTSVWSKNGRQSAFAGTPVASPWDGSRRKKLLNFHCRMLSVRQPYLLAHFAWLLGPQSWCVLWRTRYVLRWGSWISSRIDLQWSIDAQRCVWVWVCRSNLAGRRRSTVCSVFRCFWSVCEGNHKEAVKHRFGCSAENFGSVLPADLLSHRDLLQESQIAIQSDRSALRAQNQSMLDDNKKIGIGLCGIGVLCVTLGIFLLFDRTLLALGNVAFLFGLALLLGPFKAFKFFFRKDKWKGTTGYFLGIAIIIVGWPFVGFLTEMYGIWKLFAAFLPNVLASLKMTVPGAATVLNMWPLSSLCNLINDQRRLPVWEQKFSEWNPSI